MASGWSGLENGFSTVPAVVNRLARHPRFTLVRGSINSARSIERAFEAAGSGSEGGAGVDVVYHLAAQASAHPAGGPALVHGGDEPGGAAPGLRGCRPVMAPRRSSTAARSGSTATICRVSSARTRRTARIGDLSHLSKVYAEKLLEMLAGQHGVPVANVRLGVVYGLGPLMKRRPALPDGAEPVLPADGGRRAADGPRRRQPPDRVPAPGRRGQALRLSRRGRAGTRRGRRGAQRGLGGARRRRGGGDRGARGERPWPAARRSRGPGRSPGRAGRSRRRWTRPASARRARCRRASARCWTTMEEPGVSSQESVEQAGPLLTPVS